MSLRPVHKREGVLDSELVCRDRFKDINKKRGKIIVGCVNRGDNWAKGATSFVDFRKTIKNTSSRLVHREGFF